MVARVSVVSCFLFALLQSFSAALAQTTPPTIPHVQIAAAELVSPATADTYYSGLANPSVAASPLDPYLDEIARSLDYDIDRIFDFVLNSIDTTPTFGLQKGAYAAALDRAGNAFDQADLMVQLLRAADEAQGAGYAAKFVYGEITVPGSTFSDWFGPTTARGACELLSGGGVPAVVNGASATDCAATGSSGYDGSLTTVSMNHVWVEATVEGVAYAFDPSFKSYDWTSPNTSVLNAAPTAAQVRTWAGGVPGSRNGVTTLNNFTAGNLNTQLDSASASVLSALTADGAEDLSMRDVVGGKQLVPAPYFDASDAVRDVSHPHQSAATSTTTWTEIPDGFRAKLRIDARYTSELHVYGDFYAADIAGRRVSIWSRRTGPNHTGISVPPGGSPTLPAQPENWGEMWGTLSSASLEIDVDGAQAVMRNPSDVAFDTWSPSSPSTTILPSVMVTVELTVDQAYAANSGGYLDELIRSQAGQTGPTVVVQSWGERGPGASARSTQDVNGGGAFYRNKGNVSLLSTLNGDPMYFNANFKSKLQVAESWTSNAQGLIDVFANLADGRAVHHHTLGISTSSLEIANDSGIREDQLAFDAHTRVSYAERESGATSGDAFAMAVSSSFSALERAVVHDLTGDPFINSTTSMFDWLARTSVAEAGVGGADELEFLVVNASNLASAQGLLVGYDNADWRIDEYAGDNFTVIAPRLGRLGPGRKNKHFNQEWDSAPPYQGSYIPRHRASALIAYDTSSATKRIGYITSNSCRLGQISCPQTTTKGSGGVTFDTAISGPSADREYLDEQYETWANVFSVDQRTGGLTLTPPADIETGAGGYPYSLAFQRTYNSDRSGGRGPLGHGWTHNYDVRLSPASDIGAALGEHSPRHAVATIMAAKANLELYSGGISDIDVVRAALLQHWWSEQVYENAVTITRGPGSERFFRIPSGTYAPEATSTASLSLTAGPTCDQPTEFFEGRHCVEYLSKSFEYGEGDNANWDNVRVVSWAYTYEGMKWRYKSADDVIEDYVLKRDLTYELQNYPNTAPGSTKTFRPLSTIFPYGITVDYTYSGKLLVEVSNNLGRKLSFNYALNDAADPSPEPDSIDSNKWLGGEQGAPHRLVSVVDENNRTVAFAYDSCPLEGGEPLAEVTSVDGRSFGYEYVTLRAPLGEGTPASCSMRLDDRKRDIYVDRVLLSEVRLPNRPYDPFLSVDYDNFARVKSVTNAVGRTWEYGAGAGTRGFVKDPNANADWSYYDEHGRMAFALDRRGAVTETLYDGIGRTVSTRVRWASDADGVYHTRSDTTYDALHNVIEQCVHPKSWATNHTHCTQTAYDDPEWLTKPTSVTDPEGHATSIEYDATSGLPTRQLGSEGEETQFEYDSLGRPTFSKTKVDASTWRVSKVEYDAVDGLPSKSIGFADTVLSPTPSANDLETLFDWNAYGDLDSVTNPRGYETTATYDTSRRVTEIVRSPTTPTLRQTTAFEYDLLGRLLKVRAKREESPDVWDDTLVTYSATGRVRSITDPAGDMTRFTYDDLDRLSWLIDPAGRTTENGYDAAGQLIATFTSSTFDQRRCYRREEKYITGQTLSLVSAKGAAAAADCSVTDFDRQTLFNVDDWHRDFELVLPDSTADKATLDHDGQATARNTRAGDVITMNHDASHRLVRKVVPEKNGGAIAGREELYKYDLTGARLCAAVHPIANTTAADDCETKTGFIVRTTYAYDAFGRLTSESVERDGATRVVSYAYDENSNRTQISWPDGFAVDYVYDDLDRLIEVREAGSGGRLYAENAYDRLGRLVDTDFGAGVDTHSDWRGRVEFTYEIDGDLSLVRHEIGSGAGRQFNYGYDASGKVASYDPPSAWEWSAAGTDTRSYVQGASGSNADLLDQYESADMDGYEAAAISYDGNGNVIAYDVGAPLSADDFSFDHDAENRLVRACSPTCSSPLHLNVAYVYDADGRRIAKNFDELLSSHADVDFVHAGDMEIAEYDGTTLLRRYVPGAGVDQRVVYLECDDATCANPTIYFYRADRLGSVIGLTDDVAGGASDFTDQYVYTPFGIEEPLIGSGQMFRYTGRRRDPETGLYFYRARYYDPDIGRFLETDPVGYADQMNLYAYVGNDPLNATDPTGKCFLCPPEPGETSQDRAQRNYEREKLLEAQALFTPGVGAVALRSSPGFDQRTMVGSGNRNPGANGPGGGGRFVAGRLLLPLAILQGLQPGVRVHRIDEDKENGYVLIHYTDEAGLEGILADGVINASREGWNGPGVYMSDIAPGTANSEVLALVFKNSTNPDMYTHFVAMDMRGTLTEHPRKFVYIHRGPIPLAGRMVAAGPNEPQE